MIRAECGHHPGGSGGALGTVVKAAPFHQLTVVHNQRLHLNVYVESIE
ncbi:hypothetical protein [Aneurinibacillus tyrosinisolvens]|nr:hypothetical protein [Aneurinibacillus tyrosinisolvens]